MFTLADITKVSDQLESRNLTKRKRAMLKNNLQKKTEILSKRLQNCRSHNLLGGAMEKFDLLPDHRGAKVVDRSITIWDAVFEKIYANVLFPHPFHVIIQMSWDDVGSSGDVIFAYKTAYYVSTLYPRAKIFILVSLSMKLWISRNLNLPPSTRVVICPEEVYPDGWDPKGVPLVVLDAATPSSDHLKLKTIDGKTMTCSRTIHFDEYNGWRIPDINADCGNSHYTLTAGIWFDEQGRTCSGMHLKVPPVAFPSDNTLIGCLWPTYPYISKNQTKIYFGYNSVGDTPKIANKYLDRFFQIIMEYEKDNNEDFNFFIIERNKGGTRDRFFTRNNIDGDEDRKIQYEKYYNGNFVSGYMSGKKTVRVFFLDSLPHNDMMWLLKRSERLVLVTGDQSTSEAIEFNKIIVSYQIQSWKENLAEAFLQVAMYADLRSFRCFLGGVFNEFSALTPKTMAEYLHQKIIQTQATEFNNLIKKYFDIFPCIKAAINSILWFDEDEVQSCSNLPVNKLGKWFIKYSEKIKETQDRPAKRLRST